MDEKLSQKKIDSAYNLPPLLYDIRGYFILRLTYRSRLIPLVKFFSKHIEKNHLEGAIGSGTFFALVLKNMKKSNIPLPQYITAFDYSAMMLEGAVQRFKHMQNIKLYQEDACNLPYQSDSFDSCCMANSLHCIFDVDKALLELFRVLKPCGTFTGNVLLYPSGNSLLQRTANRINQWGIKKGILFTPYTKEDFRTKIINAGFSIVEEHTKGNMYNFVAKK